MKNMELKKFTFDAVPAKPKSNGRPRKYQHLYDAAMSLGLNEAVEIPLNGMKLQSMRSVIPSIRRNLPKDWKIITRLNDDETVITIYRIQ